MASQSCVFGRCGCGQAEPRWPQAQVEPGQGCAEADLSHRTDLNAVSYWRGRLGTGKLACKEKGNQFEAGPAQRIQGRSIKPQP